jgi:ketosteroid isomerase-like protein
MSQENVKIVRSIYRAWEEHSHRWRELMDPNIAYVNPDDAVEAGTIYGPDSFTKWRSGYERLDITPREFIDAGDEVVVIAAVRALGQASGMETQWNQGYVWTIQDGIAVRFRWFNDSGKALEAAGLSE